VTVIPMDIRRAAAEELERRDRIELESRLTKDARVGPEIGSTGLKVFGGVITEEHNRSWQPPTLYTTVDKMRKGDATCAAVLLSMVLPVMATEVYVEAKRADDSDPDPIVKEAAELVTENLFSGDMMTQDWHTLIREAMLYLAYGHYTFEKVYHEIRGGRWDGAIGWRKFAPRHPRTITEWNFNRNGGLTNVRQEVYEAEQSVDVVIPIEKLALFTNQPEAGNPLGVSIFRPAFKHWKYKDGFYAVQAIAIERQGAGVPFAKYPAGTAASEKDKAEQMLQNVQAHEQSYFTFEEDWEVGFMDMGSASVLDPQSAIEHHDAMISKSILASFMQLPQDGRGSFALSSDQSGFFSHSLQEAANYVASVFNQHCIPQMLDMNYPNLPTYPKLRFDRVGHISVDKILSHIATLADKGLLTSTVELENRVRDLLNLPPVDEGTFEEEKEEAEPPLPIEEEV
jgi:hypothetical protein